MKELPPAVDVSNASLIPEAAVCEQGELAKSGKDESSRACRYVDIVDGEPLTEDERQRGEANVRCFARLARSRRHVGFGTVVIVPPRPYGVSDGEEDDAPLVA